ncbi:uncharacterized protein UV8b_04200 [Ustilaginoidea virens]|uniref:RING-type domain-containing protein n=1 Tax=Ustilaginoidea virens TaxID=1159556 RepID=A0A8E5HR11_USTVR|nr:uncharacterized protein UV8b_04200 [Ustilaginoidea virens]QUC19959.1 hypothetical protein UV8b_04200 [Ustilaginoidea virens]
MSLTDLQNNVFLFSNPAWNGEGAIASTLSKNLSQQTSQLAYEQLIDTNLTTLSTGNSGIYENLISGLLFVPDITSVPSCDVQQYDCIPINVTRRKDLPPANLDLIAIAPWFSSDCTQAYLNSALQAPVKAFLFYKPNNSTNKPQDGDSPVWNLGDGGAWRSNRHFPIFAVPGRDGQKIMTQLSLYSGAITQVPHGQEIKKLYNIHSSAYLRIWTRLTVDRPLDPPATWAFILIVIGALLSVILVVSLAMHFIQRRNRNSLRRRVQSGEVDLEAMGIKRVTVPAPHVVHFPLFTYNADPGLLDLPLSPRSQAAPGRRAKKTRRKRRRESGHATTPDAPAPSAPSVRSIRSKRSNLNGTGETAATNHQPSCHICLARFEHRVTIIRELPCGHIFHTECIDEFLMQISSLCPTCKHCMLPRGYSPKITNGMVRRERALRRLREKVDLEDFLIEPGRRTRPKTWGSRLLGFSYAASPSSSNKTDVPMKILHGSRGDADAATSHQTAAAAGRETRNPSPLPDGPDPAGPDPVELAQALPVVARSQPRKSRPWALRLLPTQPEGAELKMSTAAPNRRGSPSSFARERMRQMAGNNAPFDDPDRFRPIWRRAISKAFPGF